MSTNLFTPFTMGEMELKNRFVMAPMTRSRADDAGVPSPLTPKYYAQRASAGLIITEGIYPDAMGKGYLRTPGLHNDAQISAWKEVTDTVHAEGGLIFAQIMYTGRISHPSFLGGATPVAPSAVQPAGMVYTDDGPQPFETPCALTAEEIPGIIATYRRATEMAVTAGFDGVELHATSGYLPAQFLSSNTNLRTDDWGGTLEKRARFILETLDAMTSVRGAGRVGIKIGPGFPFNDIQDAAPQETYTYLTRAISGKGLAYLNVLDSGVGFDVAGLLRPLYDGTFIANGGYTKERANSDLAEGRADLIAFGTLFLANPDLPERFRRDAPLNTPDKATFYTPGAEGYTDYPTLLS